LGVGGVFWCFYRSEHPKTLLKFLYRKNKVFVWVKNCDFFMVL
jgi:hypothetical protein